MSNGNGSAGRGLTVTVGGLPGTGTTTLCKLLQAQLGLPYTYAGATRTGAGTTVPKPLPPGSSRRSPTAGAQLTR